MFATRVSKADQVRSEAKRLAAGSKGHHRHHHAGLARTAKLMSSTSWAKIRGHGNHWLARARVGHWYTASAARAFTPHLKDGHGCCPSCGKVLDSMTQFVGGCHFYQKIRDKQLQPDRFTQHLLEDCQHQGDDTHPEGQGQAPDQRGEDVGPAPAGRIR